MPNCIITHLKTTNASKPRNRPDEHLTTSSSLFSKKTEMNRWGKNPAPAGRTGADAGAAGVGEVPVQKVNKIEFHNLISRPSINGGGGRPPRGAEDDINEKAERFIRERRLWFHRQKPGGLSSA